MVSTKVTFKDEWFDISTGVLERSEISTETLYASNNDDLEIIKGEYIKSRIGESIMSDVKHVCSIESETLSKEDMFNFMLNNEVNCTISNSNWTDTKGNPKFVKYKVSINGISYSGMDLEEAIQHYHYNYGGVK